VAATSDAGLAGAGNKLGQLLLFCTELMMHREAFLKSLPVYAFSPPFDLLNFINLYAQVASHNRVSYAKKQKTG
jgi:hypothetical protein